MYSKSNVCRMANQFVKEGYTKSDAFIKAWAIEKGQAAVQVSSSKKEVVELESLTELAQKVYQYKELQKKVEELKSQMEGIKGILVAEMEEQHTQEMNIDIFKIHYTPVISKKFNSKEFKKLHEEMYNQFTIESKYNRFEIV